MRRKIALIGLLIASLTINLCCVLLLRAAHARLESRTVRNEVEFYRAFLYAKEDTSRIPVDMLVPVDWDHMKVFPAYATPENKIRYAGYEYADDLGLMEHEDIVSCVFMKDGAVVYYVDVLAPWMFRYEDLPNGLVKMSMGHSYSVDIDPSVVPDFSHWAYYPKIDTAMKEDNPFFEISFLEDGAIALVLDCE